MNILQNISFLLHGLWAWTAFSWYICANVCHLWSLKDAGFQSLLFYGKGQREHSSKHIIVFHEREIKSY